MSAAGPGEIAPIRERFISEQYVEILDVFLLSVRILFPEGPAYLVQDNSAIHTVRIVKSWFRDNLEIRLISWPAKSPDFNLIENLCALDNARNVEHLKNNVCVVWERLRVSDGLYSSKNSTQLIEHTLLEKMLQPLILTRSN
ncbi:hypothetical protein Trydic_g2171 [Trypoxylus dichotomus]